MKRPNILIFMSDDQGPWAMHCAGTPELRTPNLDRLAGEGIRFDNFFCASPVCSPARATFLTGRIPSQHGVHDWIRHGCLDDPEGRTWHGPEESIEYLRGMTAFTDILAANDYSCGIAGKWHLGASDLPQKSHDFWCVHALGGASYTDYHVFDNSTELTHKTQYVTDFFTDRALDYLDSRKNEEPPFCLSVHCAAKHATGRTRASSSATNMAPIGCCARSIGNMFTGILTVPMNCITWRRIPVRYETWWIGLNMRREERRCGPKWMAGSSVTSLPNGMVPDFMPAGEKAR